MEVEIGADKAESDVETYQGRDASPKKSRDVIRVAIYMPQRAQNHQRRGDKC